MTLEKEVVLPSLPFLLVPMSCIVELGFRGGLIILRKNEKVPRILGPRGKKLNFRFLRQYRRFALVRDENCLRA